MEKRKLMALGKSSLVIAIPKHWMKKNDLKRGDYVSLNVQNDGSLNVYPGTEVKKERKITLSFSVEENGYSIARHIISCYLNGYTTIQLLSKNVFTAGQHSAIRSVAQILYMRIMESNSRKITINTMLDESMGSLQSGIERMNLITCSMCSDTLESIKNWDKDLATSVVSLEDDVDQFMYLLLRLIRMASQNSALAKDLEINILDCLDYQTLVHRIEHVADHVTNIAGRIITLFDTKTHLPKDALKIIIETAEIAFDSYYKATQAFLSKNVDGTNEIIDKQKEIERLREEMTPLFYKNVDENTLVTCNLCAILESIGRISEYAADIAELAIDRTYNLQN